MKLLYSFSPFCPFFGPKNALFPYFMDIKSLVTGVMVSIGGYFGCSKAAPPAATAKAPAAESGVKDLGVLQMTNNYETYISIGKDKDCRMIPKIVDRKDVQITVTF